LIKISWLRLAGSTREAELKDSKSHQEKHTEKVNPKTIWLELSFDCHEENGFSTDFPFEAWSPTAPPRI